MMGLTRKFEVDDEETLENRSSREEMQEALAKFK
jgi:hypothetical protein